MLLATGLSMEFLGVSSQCSPIHEAAPLLATTFGFVIRNELRYVLESLWPSMLDLLIGTSKGANLDGCADMRSLCQVLGQRGQVVRLMEANTGQ